MKVLKPLPLLVSRSHLLSFVHDLRAVSLGLPLSDPFSVILAVTFCIFERLMELDLVTLHHPVNSYPATIPSSVSSVTPVKFLLPPKVAYSQVLGNKCW